MVYANCITIGEMKEMSILDDVPYKYFKKYNDDDDIEVDIYNDDVDVDERPTYSYITFKFSLEYDCSGGSMPLYTTKQFKIKINYNTSSVFALWLCGLVDDDEEDDESDDNETDETDE